MNVKTGHTCPHCEERELIIDHESGSDTPNGPSVHYCSGGYVVRCSGAHTGACDSPDMTGRCETQKEALGFTIESLKDWKPNLINAFGK